MSVILRKGTIQNGQVIVPEPIDLPDGTEVTISTGVEATTEPDDGWDNSPEGIAAWLKWYDSLEPLIVTETERAQSEAIQQQQKECEKANFDRHAEELCSFWTVRTP